MTNLNQIANSLYSRFKKNYNFLLYIIAIGSVKKSEKTKEASTTTTLIPNRTKSVKRAAMALTND